MTYKIYHLHGDNIVECERTLNLICKALAPITSEVLGPSGSPVCPTYQINFTGLKGSITLVFFPGFGRWNHDILNLVRQRGGTLREAADVIVTGVENSEETPLFAIEFCGALPAGNQAWQRNGRAYSFGKSKIPYFYVAELGGFELDENRVRKAARLPNPAVPFSYTSFSLTNETPTLPVFVTSPGADASSRSVYSKIFADQELIGTIRALLCNEKTEDLFESIKLKALAFIQQKSSTSRLHQTLTPLEWQKAYETVSRGGSVVDYLVQNTTLPWKKVISIPVTPSASALMALASKLGIGLTAKDLPLCIIPRQKRPLFATEVYRLTQGRIQNSFMQWLSKDEHLSICWVMGFKPDHSDARPDRGLAPLARMIIGDDSDLLTVIYGPAAAASWHHLHNQPRALINNGLWESIMDVSDAILGDSMTDGIKCHGYLRSHWHIPVPQSTLKLLYVKPEPLKIGENDVDTVIHNLLSLGEDGQTFEGLCNPPGGDWSGISLQSVNRIAEYRWLTLPRVSAVGAKRPDHVFQIFNINNKPILLSIESKETALSVEQNIGPRLNTYLTELLKTPASIERSKAGDVWNHSNFTMPILNFDAASAVAFISDKPSDIAMVKAKANTDLLFVFAFKQGGLSCSITLYPSTIIGKIIAGFISNLKSDNLNITISIEN